jgi:hypothetical protein
MGKSPVRVAVMSGSRIVRDGLMSLIGELGDRATVVDADSVEDDDGHVDVVIYDLGAAQGWAATPSSDACSGSRSHWSPSSMTGWRAQGNDRTTAPRSPV